MEGSLQLSSDMLLVLAIVVLAAVLFITEWIRVDVTALAVLVLLGLTGLLPGEQLFSGFASNAVIAVIAVMILGTGLDRTGVMTQVAAWTIRLGQKSEWRLQSMVTAAAGLASAFMQNVGAAALFVPVVTRIAARTGIMASRLLIPMGFCTILGGTMTLIGSSPLILLNDQIAQSNRSLPPGAAVLKPFELFDVTPIGVALLTTGILYFLLLGRWLLPRETAPSGAARTRTQHYFAEIYGITGELFELIVTVDSPLVGMRIEEAERRGGAPYILAIRNTGEPRLAPPADEMIWVGTILGVMGSREKVTRFAIDNRLRLQPRLRTFGHLFNPALAGVSEVVIPPGSRLIGQTVAEARLRSRYGISVLAVNRRGEIKGGPIREQTLQAGDCLVSHSSWKDLAVLDREHDFVVATDLPKEEARPQKVWHALAIFLLTLSLSLGSDLRLAVVLLAGALAMILGGVLSIDEAYQAVSWKTVFLMAGLIPLGGAMETTGAAAWVAQGLVGLFAGAPDLTMQVVVAVLATVFTLLVSNVGAAVLLVPLAINIALASGANPAAYALLASIGVSNGFVLSSHPVNALITGPGNYRVADFMRSGAGLSVLYMAVLLLMVNWLYPAPAVG